MYIPEPEKVQEVINGLKKIEHSANLEGAFNMKVGGVQTYNHNCGTVHCVAGWFAVSNSENHTIKKLIKNNSCDYFDGADMIAEILGFKNYLCLSEYMDDNPKIWGNSFGEEIFESCAAYNGLDESSEEPMTIVIKHFEGVRDRCEEALRSI